MFRGSRIGLAPRSRVAVAAAAGVLVVLTLPAVAGARVPVKAQSPSVWTDHFCTGMVEWQAAAFDARDAGFPVVRTPVADRPGLRTAALALDAALKPPTQAIAQVTTNLERRTPSGKRGAAFGADLAVAVGRLSDAYSAARERARALKSLTPPQFAKQAPRVMTKLDADLERATKPITKLEARLEKAKVAVAFGTTPSCRRLGIEWFKLGKSSVGTPAAPAVDPATPGADDQTAPAVLLPARYRPTPEIAALAARTTMTGLGRLYFYATEPEIQTGSSFRFNCPSAEASTQQILGCYHDHSIYVLGVTRPELVTVVDVTAAHEMLHAVYEDMRAEEHAEFDPQLSALYDSTADVHIHQIVPVYERRTPLNRATELHSLIGTQVGELTPSLDQYYTRFFKDRSKVVAAYTAYISVFDNLLNRYHELDVRLTDLRDRITSLRAQANAAGGEAQGLSAQINSLRAQGRIGESNALVGPQNAAVDRANGFGAQANTLIAQYNGLVDEINGIAAELGGLDSALRPL